MKQIAILLVGILFFSCSSNNDELVDKVGVALNFTQNWDGEAVTAINFPETEYTNKLETKLTIEKLRYLISNIKLVDGVGAETIITPYVLVDVGEAKNLNVPTSASVLKGEYKLVITFGFNNDANYKEGGYSDLNTASWEVPSMLGGGYHFMQLDGKYTNKNSEKSSFNYHAIRAFNPETKETEDTFFELDLGTVSLQNNATIEIKMNMAEWFKNPNNWDLNILNQMLMGNFEAQKQMASNGKSGVFSLGTIVQ